MLAPPLKLLRGPSPLWPPSLPTPMMYKSTTVKNYKRRPTLKRSVIKYCGKLKLCLLDLDPNPSPKPLQWFETFYLRDGFITHQRINIGNKQITNKAYDESEMRTLQKRIVTLENPRV